MNQILERKSTQELDELLNAELKKEAPNGDLVRSVLRLLEEREKNRSMEATPVIQAAWDKLQAEDKGRAERPEPTARSWVIQAVSIAAVIVLLICVIPMEVQAEGWWERIAMWTDSFFEFVSPGATEETEPEYVFQTDNPGLQEVYDAVCELGVTVPVVPMWLPEGYELVECKQTRSEKNPNVFASFSKGDSNLIYRAYILDEETENRYQKDSGSIGEFEYNGLTHNIVSNKNMWTAAWVNGRVECVLSVSCEESTLRKIIWSIYISEDHI